MLRTITQYAEQYDREYYLATIELARERHKFLGLIDVIKGLLMWIETPEERVHKNLSLQIRPA